MPLRWWPSARTLIWFGSTKMSRRRRCSNARIRRNEQTDFRWTKDGQVIVCSFKLLSEITTNDVPSSPVVAYDFSRREATVPTWLIFDNTGATCKESNWRAFEPAVAKIVAAHGGLSKERKTYEDIWREEKRLWFWQIPKIVTNGQ